MNFFIFSLLSFSFTLSSQTLATFYCTASKFGDKAMQYLSDALCNNTVNIFLCSSLSVLSLLFFKYSHSLHSRFAKMKLELKESDIWLMVYERIWWISFILLLSYIDVKFFTQTLTSLELQENQIGDEGVQYLTDALKNNQVNFFISLVWILIFSYRH